jgi:hypothetical protein
MVSDSLDIFEKIKGVLFFQLPQGLTMLEFNDPIEKVMGIVRLEPVDYKSVHELWKDYNLFLVTTMPEGYRIFFEWPSNKRVSGIRDTKVFDKFEKAIAVNISGYLSGDALIDEGIVLDQQLHTSYIIEFAQETQLPLLLLDIDVSSLNRIEKLRKWLNFLSGNSSLKNPNVEIKYLIENVSSLKNVQVKHYKIDHLTALPEDISKFLRE